MQRVSTTSALLLILPSLLFLSYFPNVANGDCWLIEGDKGYVWLAICSQNQPPYETIPQHINNTVHDLRLNENKLKAVLFSSMYRFTNLTDLNLTKNDISYIEDGAFAGQANLQVLQLGYNKLTNLTEGMMRGLGRMQCLFLQHNLIEVIASNAFWECPSLSSIDLSSNKLARIDPATFTVLSRLMVCELAANPFHCGCELYSFLTWLEFFNNVSHTYDRLQCETPREMFGYPLLSPTAAGHAGRNAKNILYHHCRGGVMIPGMTSLPPDLEGPSGLGPEMFGGVGPYHQSTTSSSSTDDSFNPTIKLHNVTLSSASLLVRIPKPFSKMYILTQYNHTYVSDVVSLKNKKEMITVDKLKPLNDYTFCVVSIRNSRRYNNTCLQFSTLGRNSNDTHPTSSTTTHYIMTIVGCLFGMLIILGFVYYCLRKKRMHDEKKKSICVKKTILEMRYGPEHHHGGKLDDDGTDIGDDSDDDGHGSASEISTIAMEVDKVNQIINNCIDALKLDATCQVMGPNKIPPPPPLPALNAPLSERPGITGGGYVVTPPYRPPPPANAVRPIQRQMSADAAVVIVNSVKKQCSTTSCGSMGRDRDRGGARVGGVGAHIQDNQKSHHYHQQQQIQQQQQQQQQQQLEVQQDYHCSEHRHSVPALYYEGSHQGSPAQKVSFLKPLTRSRRDAASYSQLSPARHHSSYSGYSSSPEYSSESSLRIWERFRPYRKGQRDEACYVTAGNALRKKVQFAKGEDLHDILDYWKGVSAQQKL
uniref:Extracellular leucine rich repeat and fibronectin type III domain containing 2 n=1 Tax=Salarias fasciatus TaxID=181472 RepID=A0A672F2S7_SALFA